MSQQSFNESARLIDKKIFNYLDQLNDTSLQSGRLYIPNTMSESTYSFGTSNRQKQVIVSQTDEATPSAISGTRITERESLSPYKPRQKEEPVLSSRYQITMKSDMGPTKYPSKTRQTVESENGQGDIPKNWPLGNTGTSLDFRVSEDSIQKTISRRESSPNIKPEILTGRSLLGFRSDKLSSSPPTQNIGNQAGPNKLPPLLKLERGNTTEPQSADYFEWSSQVSLMWSDKQTEPVEGDKNEVNFFNEGYTNHIEVPQLQLPLTDYVLKPAITVGLWKKDSNVSNKSQPQQLNLVQDGQTDLLSLKKALLSPGETNGVPSKSSQNQKTSSEVGSLLDVPVAHTNMKLNTGETTKRSVYSYNPYGSQAIIESNVSEVRLTSQNSEVTKALTLVPKVTTNQEKPVRTEEKRLSLLMKSRTSDSRIIIQSPPEQSLKLKYMNSIKNPISEESGPKEKVLKVSFFRLADAVTRMKRGLRARYLKNRKEVYRYDPRNDPPVIKVVSRNKELIKKRNQYYKEDKKFQDQELLEIQETSKIEYFDSSGYLSMFSTKNNSQVPANANDSQFGKIVKSGFVRKVANKNKIYNQRWVVLRSFNLYWYKNAFGVQPKGIVPLPVTPIKEAIIDDTRTTYMILEQPRGRPFTFASDYNWKVALANEMAFKGYLEYTRENEITQKIGITEYFENEGCRSLDLCGAEINDPQLNRLIYESFHYHTKLKELNLAKTQVRGKQLEDLIVNLVNLKKHIKLEVLNLESNGITKDMITQITRFLESESSFSLKKFSLAYNPIADDGIQIFLEGMISRFEKMNSENKIKLILPLSELDLSGTRTGDQSVFTLMTIFDTINKKFGDRGVDDHRDLMTLKLADNLITDNGLQALAKALTKFHGLKELDLSNNVRLTGVSFISLLSHLKKSSSIAKLEYKKNVVDKKGLGILFANLADNFLLKKLTITLDEKLIETFIGHEEVITSFYKIFAENKM